VRWKNFLSTGNNFTEIQLDRNPTTLIIGENGAGKSTILDALCFGLFGKPFRNISKGQLLNTVNGSSAMVELEFRIGTKEIKVRRGIKPNVFEIYINGKMYNQDANARDYQKYLEQQILKLNYRSFTQVVILGSSTFVPFMQLKARHRREVVNEILDIQIFSIMNLLMRERIKTLTTDLRENEYQCDLAEEKITMQEKYIEDTKNNKKSLITEKTNLIAGNEEEIFKQEADNKILKVTNETYLNQITDSDKVKEQHSKMKDIRSTLVEKKTTNSKMLKFFEDNDNCPTCEQPLNNAEEMITAKQKEVDKFTKALDELQDVLDKSTNRQAEISDILEKIRENEVKVAQSISSIRELEKFNATLTSEIEDLQSGNVTKDEEDKLKKLKKDFSFFDKEKTKLKEELTYSEAARNMLQDTGIKTKVIKKYLPIMNKLINTYLNSMEFYVNFTLDENFNETIKSRYRDEFTYASFSEGEKMRIDLALLFTWRAVAKMKNSTNTNLLILDEIFDSSLDGTGTDEFLKILNTLGDENVFVISHKQDALADKFRSTIKFEKVKNFSHVVE
jgi:DNA repair exonuclease SbcCD ATPase subunit